MPACSNQSRELNEVSCGTECAAESHAQPASAEKHYQALWLCVFAVLAKDSRMSVTVDNSIIQTTNTSAADVAAEAPSTSVKRLAVSDDVMGN